jgi:hypothetical protein
LALLLLLLGLHCGCVCAAPHRLQYIAQMLADTAALQTQQQNV